MTMTTEKYLPYRGDLRALAGAGGVLAYVTVHAEGHATRLYRLDADKLGQFADALPAGGVALAVDGDTIWIAGSDQQLYVGSVQGGTPAPRGPRFDAPIIALALLSNNRIAALSGQAVTVLERADGRVLQTLPLPESGTSLAADPTGSWVAAGTARGVVVVFESEDKPQFQQSASERLHEGAVTALLFEPDELRFLSAGADLKLLTTHARGKLEPEDKGRGNMHSDVVVRMLWGPGDRLLTGSRDRTVKSWPRAGNVKPVTLKDGVGVVVDLAIVHVHNQAHLAIACDDNTIRIFRFDEAGKFGDMTAKVFDALAAARRELKNPEIARREAALKYLVQFQDRPSIEMISEQVGKDSDHAVRLLAAQLLGGIRHPRAARLLEPGLAHNDEAVRVAAFQGLRRQLGEQEFRPLDLALRSDHAEIGKLAIQALEALAGRDDQARSRLVGALQSKQPEVRQAALTALEKVHDAQSPEASLLALTSSFPDLRKLALDRLQARGLLADPRVQTALRRRIEDDDAVVRRTAYLLSLLSRPALVATLAARDPELQRQLGSAVATTTKATTLSNADLEPLLQASACRHLDTCLAGARALAMLGDQRAFGLLLQLSREETPSARVEVCRALAALNDPRSIKRLRSLLFDVDPAVRDAAFTALAQLHTGAPLLAAESGLSGAFEDVRRRGLQVLIAEARKAIPKHQGEKSWQLLVRALNDNFPAVRAEAFKAALNLQVGGGGIQTLRFTLQSIHADVRREVLTEVMAQFEQPWAWNLLLEFFNDHDAKLRAEAFAFAVKKAKDLAPLAAALRAQYVDIRKQAVEALIKKHTEPAEALLVTALADPEKEVRLRALAALIGADARGPLVQALKSTHADVRVRAAGALARHGESAALAPLVALASAPEPAETERQADWAALVESALAGLAELGDAAALPHVTALLGSRHASLRAAAARALVWTAVPHHTETLRQALQHADATVKYQAALGLAFARDNSVAALVFSEPAKQVLTAAERIAAAFALGPSGEDALALFLDDEQLAARNHALLLLLLQEMKAHGGTPSRLLACLASRLPQVRLIAVRALESFADADAFRQFVIQQFNDRGDDPAWKVNADALDTLADLLIFGTPATRARSALLLRLLGEKEQAAWDQAWAAHANRFLREVAAIREKLAERRAAITTPNPAALQQLAFGAYVGLVREQGGVAASNQRPTQGAKLIAVRQAALQRLLVLAGKDPGFRQAVVPIFVQALSDPNQAVRLQAFEQLQGMGMDRAALGAEALEAGHTDLGVRGLELLTRGEAPAAAQAILEKTMLTRQDDLALEAGKLLAGRRDAVDVAGGALEAAAENVRAWGIETLSASYEKSEPAHDHLRRALGSRHHKVRQSAAFELANKKDAAAFDALVTLLAVAEASGQRRALQALVKLGDPRTPDALLDRLEHDEGGTALTGELLPAVADFRQPTCAGRLFTLFERHKKLREEIFTTLLTISGYDQPIEDPEDERPDRAWEKKQHPRHDDLLARLLQHCADQNATESLSQLLPAARWARGKEVEPVLSLLVLHAEEEIRRQAVEAIGWRLRKRDASAEPLLKALGQQDSDVQFLAAVALARARRAEGINVLLAAVDFMTDHQQREQAVQALGELADIRALDLLLKMAGEDGHALQSAALEAVGHFGGSDKREEIFHLLDRKSRDAGSWAHDHAVRGLRWFNSLEAWKLVRQLASENAFMYSMAVEMLGFNDEPATRELLLRTLATADDGDVIETARTSARRLHGEESLEPDYALVQSKSECVEDVLAESLKRVCERGDARRILEIVPKCRPAVQDQLATSLLNRPTQPIEEARLALASADERSAALAARLLARAGVRSPEIAAALTGALDRWRALWNERRRRLAYSNEEAAPLETLTTCLQGLLWAAGRLGAAPDVVIAMSREHPGDPRYRLIRREAVFALAAGPLSDASATALEAVLDAEDPEARTIAAEALARHRGARPAALAGKLLSDRVSFNRLVAKRADDVTETLRAAAGQVHYQAVALPHLISRGDLDGLNTVLANTKLPLAARLGAVEGIARIGTEAAEARLAQLSKASDEDEELRKAAWRALKRAQRARQQAQARQKSEARA
jgi:ParB family chromosome partitioning protein